MPKPFDPLEWISRYQGKPQKDILAAMEQLTHPQKVALHNLEMAIEKEEAAQKAGRGSIPEDPASFAEKYSYLYGGSGGKRDVWRRAKHLDAINELLVDLYTGKKQRVIVALPMRHGKSEFITFFHTLWRLAKNPAARIGLFGYSHDFIRRRAGAPLRDYVRDYGAEFGVHLDPTSTSAQSWKTTEGGYVHTAGRGGSAAGMSFDLITIDDPYKNYEEAASEVIREATWNWWTTAIWSRKQPQTRYLLVQTLWHMDDLACRLIRESEAGTGPKWDVLKLPAIAEKNDAFGREEGEPLWPEGIPLEDLLVTKQGTPAFQWSALYQQNPIPAEGNMFPMGWWQYWEVLPDKFDVMIQSWDFSFKDAKKADFVVGQVWGRKGASFYLVDQIRARMSAKDSIQAIRAFTGKYPQARAKLFEDKANGPALKALLQHEVGGIIPINPKGSKEARAAAVTPFVQAGNVYLPAPKVAPWVNDLVVEAGQFPNGSNDDQIDSLTQALNYLAPQGFALLNRLQVSGQELNESRENNPLKLHQDRIWGALEKEVKKNQREHARQARGGGRRWNC